MNTRNLTVGIVMALLTLSATTNIRADALHIFKNEKGVIKIAGGTAHIPVVKEAAKRIMNFNPDIQISVAGGGSGVGIKQAGEGLVDIGNSGRMPSENEIKRYNLKVFQWAVDGVGIIVNPKNNVKALSTIQVIDIFSGKINNWQILGSKNKGINVYTRNEASGTRTVFWKKALNKGKITPKANFVVSNGAMKSAISQDPYSIGYVSIGHIDGSVAPVAVDHVLPTLDNVKNGSYKIVRGLYSNTKGNPSGLIKKFIEYLLTPECQEMVRTKGFIPVI